MRLLPSFGNLIILFLFFFLAGSQSFIGINYGLLADNLPPPTATAKLLQSTSIQKMRLYGADPAVLKALANTGIGIVIGAANGDIPPLASDPNSATQWINANILPYYPASKIILVTIGNEVTPHLHLQLLIRYLEFFTIFITILLKKFEQNWFDTKNSRNKI